MDVRVKVGDSTLKSGRIIRLFADRTRFTHSGEVGFYSILEAGSDVVVRFVGG